MIKANELRIGNILYSNLTERNFACTSEDIYNLSIDCNANNANYIPLTKEWLLKAGFERLFPTGSTYSLRDFNVSDFGENGIYHYDVKQPIKYVHQLQNLYFSIIGEELVFSSIEL